MLAGLSFVAGGLKMLDKILPFQEAFLASQKSHEDMWRFLDNLSKIIEREEEETDSILGVFVFFDGVEFSYEWDGGRFSISPYNICKNTGFGIYVNDGKTDSKLHYSLHDKAIFGIPYPRGHVVYYNTGWKTSVDVGISIHASYNDAEELLNSIEKNPEYNYYIR
jgi:hypothetical protein